MKSLLSTASPVGCKLARRLACPQRWNSTTRPAMRACIIGSGPAGFYSAYRLLSNLPDCEIDVWESLPVPYGLARFGVAPDHPEVKNVTHTFDKMMAGSTDRLRFIGNVEVGRDVGLTDLAKAYDVILFAYGAAMNKKLALPGEDLPGVMSARSFVGWYNGLPEASSLRPRLDGEVAYVIGQGNVALDIARILLSSVDDLRRTDIAEHALEALSKSRVKEVRIVGRRGPLQASFTIKEIRELITLTGTTFLNQARPRYQAILNGTTLPRPQKRLMELLAKQEPKTLTKDRSWDIEYALSPKAFKGSDRLEGIDFERNALNESGGRVHAVGTGEVTHRPADLALLSIGYQSRPIEGMSDIGVVFDTTRHIIPNEHGRVRSLDGTVDGVYCSGWVKLGPVGVIASTMRDAFETADNITQDWRTSLSKRQAPKTSPLDIINDLRKKKQIVEWNDWKKIEARELEAGLKHDRTAQKIASIEEMLRIAGR